MTPKAEYQGTYQHTPSGAFYEYLGHGILADTREPCVIYQSVTNGTVWVRAHSEFFNGDYQRVRTQLNEDSD